MVPSPLPVLKRVQSSNLHSWGYDAATGTLLVKFKSSPNKVHPYAGVPVEVASGMDDAESIGSYFAKAIRREFVCGDPIDHPDTSADGSSVDA